ncbi:hypothetical protein Tco_0874584 [Tanacetum coccineum]|uniref:Uncharacterized protein n=1 Tax=Tanacetum coccineum TaxID=301880 RepID=A0ABQ5BMT0_9ASTR
MSVLTEPEVHVNMEMEIPHSSIIKFITEYSYSIDKYVETRRDNQDRDLVLRRKKERSLDYNSSFLGEYECSSLALDREKRRDEKEEIGSLEARSNNVSDQEI